MTDTKIPTQNQIENSLNKDFPIASQNNIERVEMDTQLGFSDGLDKETARRKEFFKNIFLLTREFTIDTVENIPANTDTLFPVQAFGFNGNQLEVVSVDQYGYTIKTGGEYQFSLNMPSTFVQGQGFTRIELSLAITRYAAPNETIIIHDMSIGSGHTTLDQMFEEYTIEATKRLYLGSRDSIVLQAKYYNSGNPAVAQFIYKQGGSWTLQFVKPQ